MAIRVLEVMSGLSAGGAETMMMNILRNIDREKYKIDFLIFESEPTFYTSEVESYGCKIYMIEPIRQSGIKKYMYNIKKILKSYGPYDVVHSHLDIVSALVMVVAKRCGIPCRIAHSHSTAAYTFKRSVNSFAMFFIRKMFALYATDFFACGVDAARFMFGNKKGQQANIINNAIDLDRFCNDGRYNRNMICKNLNISPTDTIITNIARFTHVKNQKYLIDVFSEYCEFNPKSVLLLIGDGDLKQETEEYAAQKSIHQNIYFLGMRRDIPEILSITDVFALPSLFEGLPVTLIEAQAMDVSCVISDVITREVDCGLNLIKYVSLNSVSDWVSAVRESVKQTGHRDNHDVMQKMGYDIHKNIMVVEAAYMSKSEGK